VCSFVVRKLSLLAMPLTLCFRVWPWFPLEHVKDPVAIFVGATLVGLLGAATVQLLRATTRHKEDAALGFVLASFFGVGICLFTMIQNMPGGNKSGLDKFMFGQAAALGRSDVILRDRDRAGAFDLSVYKEYAITSFDAGFARSLYAFRCFIIT
jgi:manganese/zinc/iron transport system permease protein